MRRSFAAILASASVALQTDTVYVRYLSKLVKPPTTCINIFVTFNTTCYACSLPALASTTLISHSLACYMRLSITSLLSLNTLISHVMDHLLLNLLVPPSYLHWRGMVTQSYNIIINKNAKSVCNASHNTKDRGNKLAGHMPWVGSPLYESSEGNVKLVRHNMVWRYLLEPIQEILCI